MLYVPTDDMPEYDVGCDFGDDDDLGDAEAIQALSNAENSQDEKPQIKVNAIIGLTYEMKI